MKTTIAITTGSISLLLLASSFSTLRAVELPGPNGNPALTADGPFAFELKRKAHYDYLSFKGAPKPEAHGVRFKAKNSQGGAGYLTKLDLSKAADFTPAITLTVGPENKAKKISITIGSNNISAAFSFNLTAVKPGEPVTLTADEGAALGKPVKPISEEKLKDFDLTNVSVIQVQGDWKPLPVDVLVTSISFVPPTEEMKTQREATAKRQAQAAEKAAKEAEKQAILLKELQTKGSEHPADGPQVEHVCAVAADVLAISIQAGKTGTKTSAPYVAMPGDEVIEEPAEKGYQEIIDGKPTTIPSKTLYRMVNGKRTRVPGFSYDGKWLVSGGATTGKMLDVRIADAPACYTIQSKDDPAYAQATQPTAVFRKGKPNSYTRPLAVAHTISLKLPSPLKEGASYTVRFAGINTAQESVTYKHTPRQTMSLAVHAIQTGYRPDDPFKRAYLSFWMGFDGNGKSAGATQSSERFELIDATGKTAFTGKIILNKEAGQTEQICLHESIDYSKAAVYRMDFSEFATQGEFRVFVPGLGTSDPFKIAKDVWEKPFKAAMHGILTQRSGIALGPPFTEFHRPRPFHPDDGVQFYQMTIPLSGGQEKQRGNNLVELAKEGKLKRLNEGLFGGYQDAGDWDTLAMHMSATYDLLGLYDFNPEAFMNAKLLLPEAEMKNKLPDILDEALWQMPLFRKLQLPDGSVRGGYGYGWGCPKGVTSDMIKSVGVYDVSYLSTYRYVSAAARAARILTKFDKAQAADYLESAKRAWAWAEKSINDENSEYFKKAKAMDPKLPGSADTRRAEAAVELMAATGDNSYDAIFRKVSDLTRLTEFKLISQTDSIYAYSRLPDGLGDPELKKTALLAITTAADFAIECSKKNAFDVMTGRRPDIPLIFVGKYFSTPAGGGLLPIYAYELTKKPEYLRAAVQGSNYCLGANQDNLSYCTNIGSRSQRNAFRVDAIVNGQAGNQQAMMGHIPYGQGNESNPMSKNMNSWILQWILNFGKEKNMMPDWYSWPTYEQYLDFAIYPLHNENCFNDTTVPAACYWFWLHHRK